MTNEKLLDLLREARDQLVGAQGMGKATRTIARIDAALAERQDSATPVVKWEQRQGSYIHDDGVNELRVYLWGDQWHWHTVVEYRANGTCATESEARRAATAAARGMR
jgi:hypothetical protein